MLKNGLGYKGWVVLMGKLWKFGKFYDFDLCFQKIVVCKIFFLLLRKYV